MGVSRKPIGATQLPVRALEDFAPERILRRAEVGGASLIRHDEALYVPFRYYLQLYRTALAALQPNSGASAAHIETNGTVSDLSSAERGCQPRAQLIGTVEVLMDKGIHQFHDRVSRVGSVAALGFLIQHCAVQARRAIERNDLFLFDAMCRSLLSIADCLRHFRGHELRSFVEASSVLRVQTVGPAPQIATEQHPGRVLFSLVHRELLDFEGVDITAYYYDVDLEGRAFTIN